jgi:hypothetical protein
MIHLMLELVLVCERGSESTDSMKTGHNILSDYKLPAVVMVLIQVFCPLRGVDC